MSELYDSVVTLFYHLANAFFWPVAVSLLLLFAYALLDLGALIYESFRRRGESRVDLRSLARSVALIVETNDRGELDRTTMSRPLRRFWERVSERLEQMEGADDLDLWLDEVLRREEMEIANRLDRSRAFVRIGPMLGLAGTIIPLGPALQSLLGGDMAGMVNHLVVGFGAVVCGLMLSGIAYFITLVRERWARGDIKDMEDLSELLMRAVQRGEIGKEIRNAASLHPA